MLWIDSLVRFETESGTKTGLIASITKDVVVIEVWGDGLYFSNLIDLVKVS